MNRSLAVRSFGLLLFASGAILASHAHAQTARSGNDNVRAMQQLQQLSAERLQLEAENSKLKAQVDDLNKQLQQATAGKAALEAKTKNLEAAAGRDATSSKESSEQLEKTRAQMQELIAKFRETAQTLKETEIDRNENKAKLAQRDGEFRQCVDRNAEFYSLNGEILDHLEHKGVWSSLKEAEPFTRIARARLENLIDDYRARAEDLKLEAAPKTLAENRK